MKVYKQALQANLRYPYRGQCTTEDLFDLDVEELNEVYKSLERERGDVEGGLLKEPTADEDAIELKMDIVEDIFGIKQREIEARKAQAERKVKKDRLLEILASKEYEVLQDKSPEELREMIEEL
jgi:hypothetical protein